MSATSEKTEQKNEDRTEARETDEDIHKNEIKVLCKTIKW